MQLGQKKVDHIVYAVPNLAAAIQHIESKFGVAPVIGGVHPTQGTMNALLNLGDGCYFELLAIDPNNSQITPPRWMGIDLIQAAQITRWAVQSEDMASDGATLQAYHPKMGQVTGGQRRTNSGSLLTWQLSMPLTEPEVEVVPFLLDWSQSDRHPTEQLPERCRLVGIELTHPNPEAIQPLFQSLSLDLNVAVGPTPSIQIRVDSPNGVVVL